MDNPFDELPPAKTKQQGDFSRAAASVGLNLDAAPVDPVSAMLGSSPMEKVRKSPVARTIAATQDIDDDDPFAALPDAPLAKGALAGSLMGPAAGDIERTGGELIDDTALAIRQGARNVTGSTLGLPVNVANLALDPPPVRALKAIMGQLGIELPDNPIGPIAQPEAVTGIRQQLSLQNQEDEAATASEKLLAQRAELGQQEGVGSSLAYLAMNPTAILDQGAQQVGQVLNVAPGAGTAVNIGVGAMSAASQNAAQVEEALRASGVTDEAVIAEAASNAFQESLALNAGVAALPGGRAIESAIGGGAKVGARAVLPAAARGAAGEALGGAISEGGDQIIQNQATGRPLDEGLGQAVALGTIFDGIVGAGAGASNALAGREAPAPIPQPEAQPLPGQNPLSAAITDIVGAMSQQPAPAPTPAPTRKPTATEAGTIIDDRLAELQRAAEDGRLDDKEVAGLKEQDARIVAELKKQEQYDAGLVPARPEMRLSTDQRAALSQMRAGIKQALEKAAGTTAYRGQLDETNRKLANIDSDAGLIDFAAAMRGELPVDGGQNAGVQKTPQQPAASIRESGPNGQAESQEGSGQEGRQEPQAGPGSGRKQAQQEEVARAPGARPGAVTAGAPPLAPAPEAGSPPQEPASPLEPRLPAQEQLPDGYSESDARMEVAAARTPDERARAAGRLAQVLGRKPDATVASRSNAGNATASGAGRVRTGDADVEVREALGSAAKAVTIVTSASDIPADVAKRAGINSESNADVEGFYDPQSGQAYVIEDALDTNAGMTPAERRVWVAAHERSGHAGLRGMAGDSRTMLATLDRANQNDTVRNVAEAMQRQRPERGPAITEEAIAELAAAVRTGNYDHIEQRYGVKVPEAQRKTVRGYIERLVQQIRSALKLGPSVSDAEIYKLIEDAHRYASENDAKPTGKNAGTVALRKAPQQNTFIATTKAGEFRLTDEAAPAGADFSEFGEVRIIEAFKGGQKVGQLLYANDGTPPTVEVEPEFRRQGVATAMYKLARQQGGVLGDANEGIRSKGRQYRTDDGQAFRSNANEDAVELSPQIIASRTSSNLLRNLTPAEQNKVTDKVAEKVVNIMTKLPPKKEMAAVAFAGKAKRGWYAESTKAIAAIFGPDAPKFAGLLAALSPQISVEGNLKNALNVWAGWQAAGRPSDPEAILLSMRGTLRRTFGNSLPAWENNAVRALTDAPLLSGPKVNSFMQNLLGNVEEVTNDAWMANFAKVNQTLFKGNLLKSGKDPGKGAGYLAMNARVRETAKELTKLTGETWTPAEVQETIWSWAKTLTELADSAAEVRNAKELVADEALTDELIASTPDFGTLLTDPQYASILEEAGYGEELDGIRAGQADEGAAGEKSTARSEASPFDRDTQRKLEGRAAARIDQLRKERLEAEAGNDLTEPEEDIPFSRKRTVNPYGEDAGTDLKGMPTKVKVGDRVVEFHGYAPAQQIAAKYAKRHGNKLPSTYAQVDEERAERIAAAYDSMKHDPQNPEVKKAYGAMIDETLQQYRDILKTGLEIEFIQGEDPYAASPREAILDVVENNHLWVFPTDNGFGSSELDVSDNPLLAETEFKISGKTALANDIFRVVHDYFGHIENGVGFRADGEENAWRAHSAMYSPLARRAMTSETRGQNSWVNYGPNGEANRTASAADTVYADQKTGLLPKWVSDEGRADAGWSSKPVQPEAVSVDAYHYSRESGLDELDPTQAGSGAAGRERKRFGTGRFGKQGGNAARIAFYVREPGADVPAPESMVGTQGRNLYRVQLDNLYDLQADPLGIAEDNSGNPDATEEAISEAGFDGLVTESPEGIEGRTAVVFDVDGTIPVTEVDDVPASRRTPAQANAQRNQLLGTLAAQGYAQGQPVPIVQGGKFQTAKAAADAVRIKLQDKMLPLLRRQEAAGYENEPGVTSITLDDTMNAYRAENLMHGRAKDQLDSATTKYIMPAQEQMRRLGVSADILQDVMIATHAPERNAKVASLKGGMQDGAAGITTQEAADILAGKKAGPYSGKMLTPEQVRDANLVWQKFRAIRDLTIQNMVDSGQIDQTQATQLTSTYKDYVPLRGVGQKNDEFDQKISGTGRGLTVVKARIKRALGRGKGNLPEDILGEIVGDLQRSIAVKEKSVAARALLKFALAHPMDDFFKVEPVDLEWKYSEATGEVYLGVRNSAEDVDRSIVVRHDGKPVRLRFEGPSGEQLRDAVMNMGVADVGDIVHYLGFVNRVRSALLTRFNPAFTPINVLRDIQFGMTALLAERGPVFAAKAAANYLPAMWAAGRDSTRFQRGDSSVPDAQKTNEDWAREAAEQGMKTGLSQVDDVQDLQKRLAVGASTVMQLAAQGKPIRAVSEAALRSAIRPIAETIETINDATENALRLATYIQDRKAGKSPQQAAEYAKNLTINFNRKGQYGPFLNSFYMFFNASMQGTHAVARVMRNPKVVAGLVALAGLQAFMVEQLMDDDEDGDGVTTWDSIPDYVKRTSFIIPLGILTGNKKDYFALPMPYGFNVFPYAGARLTQMVKHGKRPTDSSVAADLFKSMAEAFSPVPIEEGYGSLFGDQVAFMMNLASNKDDLGRRIGDVDPYADYESPRALTGRVDTPRAYHAAAQLLAKMGGGDLDERIPPIGYLDASPEQLEYMTNYMGGGVASLINKGTRWWEQADAENFDSGMQSVSQMPVLSRLMGTASDARAVAERYYGERGEFSRNKDIIGDRIKKGEDPEAVLADRKNEYTRGLAPEKYKKTGKRPDGSRYKKGEGKRTDTGNAELESAENSPAKLMKDAEKKVTSINKAIKQIRAGKLTNEEIAGIIVGYRARGLSDFDERKEYTAADIGLPDGYDGSVVAPKRVQTRAIKLLQDSRIDIQQVPLRGLELERDHPID